MSIGSGLDPINDAEAWHTIILSGVKSPGVIPVDGIRGFKRETGWDVRRAKGQAGATLVRTNNPPSEGEIDFQLWTGDHFFQWQQFVTAIQYQPSLFGKPGEISKIADAITIYHPSLAQPDIDITQVVIKHISPIRHVGQGLYVVTIEFIEWRPPPPVSVVSQTTKADPSLGKDTPGIPAAPAGDVDQQNSQSAWAEAQSP